jgi:glycosidase
MQWSTEPHARFTASEKPCLSVIDNGPYGYEHVNVAKQRRDPNAMLNWTERIIRMRKEVPKIGWSDFKVIAVCDPAVRIIAMTGTIIRCCSSTISMRRRARFHSRSGCAMAAQTC